MRPRLTADDVAELDLEFFFSRESLPYKTSRGSSGYQINTKHCPFCGDNRWRTYMNAETGAGNCFVCNASFNATKFIHAYLGASWVETFNFIAALLKEQGWRPKRTMSAVVEDESKTVKLPGSIELPTPDGQNLAYLEQRGIGAEIVKYFHLRWCQFGWFDAKDDEGKPWRQFFNDTVIIPVYDLDGKLMTFQGRDLTGKRASKYLFPMGLPGTGRYLFNGHNVQATSEIAMGEGAFDVAAMKAAFDSDTRTRHVVSVGSFGKHLSYGSEDGNDQLGRFLQLKRRGVKSVVIMWDGEEKALVAALNVGKLLTGIGLVARIALLPAGKDPNEVLPEVVVAAYLEAKTWTPALDVKLRLRNPYASARK